MPAQTSVAQPLPDPLSPRELEVLQLLAAGASNQEIAAALVLAPATVKLHMSHILFSSLNALGSPERFFHDKSTNTKN